jgi:hypothetical protein
VWSSVVVVQELKFASDLKASKREAEQDASMKAYNHFTGQNPVVKKWPDSPRPTVKIVSKAGSVYPDLLDLNTFQETNSGRVVFVDLENVQPDSTILERKSHPLDKMHGFLSSFSTVDISRYRNFMTVHTIDSPITEAADHLITYTAGKMVSDKSIDVNTQIVIVSRDKASAILVHLLQKDGFAVHHYKNAKEFENSL